ncbi:MAG: hypothetical protein JNK15_12905 [Planctomycetes bacterium]|nr:hypothetical protein [Planctomycetota bacterium]
MSGEQARNDDTDFPDDDFVIEDLAGKGDDLDQLFATPPAKPAGTPAAPADAAAVDSDDLLFTDHTQGLRPSQSFQGKPGFDETTPSTWRGEELVLDEAGEPVAETPEQADPSLADAEATFTEELGSLLQNEEEFALDTEKELELVDGPTGDGVSELEQSGPFVLDDGDGAWQEQEAAPAEGAPEPVAAETEAATDAETEAEAENVEFAEPTLVADEAPVEPGWEPLPEANVDQLAEVGEVAPADGQPEEVAAEAEAEPVAAAVDLAEVDGHDVYTESTPAPVLVGPAKARPKTGRLWLAAAAAVALAAGGAVTVLRPEWLGLALEPATIEQVAIERPQVRVEARKPDVVAVAPPTPVRPADPQPVVPESPVLQTPDPVAKVEPTKVEPTKVEPDPSVSTPPANEVPLVTPPTPVVSDPVATTTPEVQPLPVEPVAPPVEAPVAKAPTAVDPVAVAWPSPEKPPKTGGAAGLVRISDDTMVGAADDTTKPVRAVEGMLPGTRAFAQLHNGNYFIGAVKLATADQLTLRIDNGEVTLAAIEIARLTQLGSADYDELQKATSGFVRLTNNNRLVGGILSQIADDHIVLEFRSNRVMLPKSAIGQVVQGVDESGVRLDVTREEDEWLRTLAGRQVGSGVGGVVEPALPKPNANPGSVPPSPPAGRQR